MEETTPFEEARKICSGRFMQDHTLVSLLEIVGQKKGSKVTWLGDVNRNNSVFPEIMAEGTAHQHWNLIYFLKEGYWRIICVDKQKRFFIGLPPDIGNKIEDSTVGYPLDEFLDEEGNPMKNITDRKSTARLMPFYQIMMYLLTHLGVDRKGWKVHHVLMDGYRKDDCGWYCFLAAVHIMINDRIKLVDISPEEKQQYRDATVLSLGHEKLHSVFRPEHWDEKSGLPIYSLKSEIVRREALKMVDLEDLTNERMFYKPSSHFRGGPFHGLISRHNFPSRNTGFKYCDYDDDSFQVDPTINNPDKLLSTKYLAKPHCFNFDWDHTIEDDEKDKEVWDLIEDETGLSKFFGARRTVDRQLIPTILQFTARNDLLQYTLIEKFGEKTGNRFISAVLAFRLNYNE